MHLKKSVPNNFLRFLKSPFFPIDMQPRRTAAQLCEGDCGVCVTILSITLLAIVVTIVKIIVLDIRWGKMLGYFSDLRKKCAVGLG